MGLKRHEWTFEPLGTGYRAKAMGYDLLWWDQFYTYRQAAGGGGSFRMSDVWYDFLKTYPDLDKEFRDQAAHMGSRELWLTMTPAQVTHFRLIFG